MSQDGRGLGGDVPEEARPRCTARKPKD